MKADQQAKSDIEIKDNAKRGKTCHPATAFKAARTAMYIGLKHPESAVIDSLEQAFIQTSGDSVMVSMDALAPNSFGVKDNVHLMAIFQCRNDSLFWLTGMIGNSLLDVEGKPVDAQAGMDWSNKRHEEQMKALRAE